MPAPMHLSRAEILRARRACNKAIRLSAPLVGGAAEIYAVLKRLGLALKNCKPRDRPVRDPGIPALKRKADDIFSVFIRHRDADAQGICHCVSCGKPARWQDMDAGHFIGRQYEVLRYNEFNVYAQCRDCNRFQEGNKAGYEKYIVRNYGTSRLAYLLAKKKHTRLTRVILQAIIDLYTAKVKAKDEPGGAG